MANLTKQDLIEYRNGLSKVIEAIHQANIRALNDKIIDLDKFDQIEVEKNSLMIQENRLNIRIINMELDELLSTDTDNPKDKIIAATEKLKIEVQRLEEFKRFMDAITNVITLVATLVRAIQIPSMAAIEGILIDIGNLR